MPKRKTNCRKVLFSSLLLTICNFITYFSNANKLELSSNGTAKSADPIYQSLLHYEKQIRVLKANMVITGVQQKKQSQAQAFKKILLIAKEENLLDPLTEEEKI